MSNTQDESAVDDEVTPSQSQLQPETTVAISAVDIVGESINQVFYLKTSSFATFCSFSCFCHAFSS
jgi:hypothetical protein